MVLCVFAVVFGCEKPTGEKGAIIQYVLKDMGFFSWDLNGTFDGFRFDVVQMVEQFWMVWCILSPFFNNK